METAACLDTIFRSIKKPTLSQLLSALRTLECSVELLVKHIPGVDGTGYGRWLLYRSDEVEVVLLQLPGLSQTPVHDHGESIGCAMVLQGELRDISYGLGDKGETEEAAVRRLQPGDRYHVWQAVFMR